MIIVCLEFLIGHQRRLPCSGKQQEFRGLHNCLIMCSECVSLTLCDAHCVLHNACTSQTFANFFNILPSGTFVVYNSIWSEECGTNQEPKPSSNHYGKQLIRFAFCMVANRASRQESFEIFLISSYINRNNGVPRWWSVLGWWACTRQSDTSS